MSKLKNNCPWNYHGSKGKFYGKIKHLLPEDDCIKGLDLFAGGASLSAILPDTWEITCNDSCWDVGNMQGQFLSDYKDSCLSAQEWVQGLAKSSDVRSNKDGEGYLSVKEAYNKIIKVDGRWERGYIFHDLVCSSFSNYIRFNDQGEWNLNFGNRYFNPSMQKKLIDWLVNMENKNVTFTYKNWVDVNFNDFDFIIIDPPYLNTCATYNKSWSEEQLVLLLKRADEYTKRGGRFILFEEVLSKGKHNKLLADWMKKYHHITLGDESSGCNYQREEGVTLEVCVYN